MLAQAANMALCVVCNKTKAQHDPRLQKHCWKCSGSDLEANMILCNCAGCANCKPIQQPLRPCGRRWVPGKQQCAHCIKSTGWGNGAKARPEGQGASGHGGTPPVKQVVEADMDGGAFPPLDARRTLCKCKSHKDCRRKWEHRPGECDTPARTERKFNGMCKGCTPQCKCTGTRRDWGPDDCDPVDGGSQSLDDCRNASRHSDGCCKAFPEDAAEGGRMCNACRGVGSPSVPVASTSHEGGSAGKDGGAPTPATHAGEPAAEDAGASSVQAPGDGSTGGREMAPVPSRAPRALCKCQGDEPCRKRRKNRPGGKSGHKAFLCGAFAQTHAVFQGMCKACAPDARVQRVCDGDASCRASRMHATGKCSNKAPIDAKRTGICNECARVRTGPCLCSGERCEDHKMPIQEHGCKREPAPGQSTCDICAARHSRIADMFRATIRVDAARSDVDLSEPGGPPSAPRSAEVIFCVCPGCSSCTEPRRASGKCGACKLCDPWDTSGFFALACRGCARVWFGKMMSESRSASCAGEGVVDDDADRSGLEL